MELCFSALADENVSFLSWKPGRIYPALESIYPYQANVTSLLQRKSVSPSANGSKLPFVYIFYQVYPCKASIIEQSGSFCYFYWFKRPQPHSRSWRNISRQHYSKSQAQSSSRYIQTSIRHCGRGPFRRPEGRPLCVFFEVGIHSPSCQPTPTAPETTRSNRP